MNRGEKGFHGFGIAPSIMEVLARLNFVSPTPIQEQAIPPALQGKDIVGIAQTGTGKTLAFGIPVIQQILQNKGNALIIAPTRELALQIDEAIASVARGLGIHSAVLIGGEPMTKQLRQLYRNPRIVIGTPGRIVDHLEQKTITFNSTKMLVLDEADRMLDMGFAPQLKKIHSFLPKERQTMLFSATMPESVFSIARIYCSLPIRVEVAPQGSTAKDVSQEIFFVHHEDKPRLLEKILQEYQGSVLVFTRTKYGAKRISYMIRGFGISSAEIHSNRTLGQRKQALDGFKKGIHRVLVATDIAARGIDVKNIELVINYDLPENAEDYVHRIGRTGRAGGIGHAISFARPDEKRAVHIIERLISKQLPISKLPELPSPHPIHRVEKQNTFANDLKKEPKRTNHFKMTQDRRDKRRPQRDKRFASPQRRRRFRP